MGCLGDALHARLSAHPACSLLLENSGALFPNIKNP